MTGTPDSDAELHRTAVHEAGHAVMAHVLGHRLGPVTIVPNGYLLGRACHDGFRVPDAQRVKLGLPVPLLPALFRKAVETSVMVSLAGPRAELCYSEPLSGFFRSDPDEVYAEELIRLAAPTPREAQRLAVDVDREDAPTDEQKASVLAFALAGDGYSAAAYLGWLSAETVEVVQTPTFGHLVGALVPPLLTHRTLSARAVRALLKGARR